MHVPALFGSLYLYPTDTRRRIFSPILISHLAEAALVLSRLMYSTDENVARDQVLISVPVRRLTGRSMNALRRTNAPRGEDSTHQYCFHTLPILPRSRVVQLEHIEPGRQLREASARKCPGAAIFVSFDQTTQAAMSNG